MSANDKKLFQDGIQPLVRDKSSRRREWRPQWVYVDVAETDFNKVAKRIASEGFGITEPNPAGGNTAVWYPAGVIKRIEAAIP